MRVFTQSEREGGEERREVHVHVEGGPEVKKECY